MINLKKIILSKIIYIIILALPSISSPLLVTTEPSLSLTESRLKEYATKCNKQLRHDEDPTDCIGFIYSLGLDSDALKIADEEKIQIAHHILDLIAKNSYSFLELQSSFNKLSLSNFDLVDLASTHDSHASFLKKEILALILDYIYTNDSKEVVQSFLEQEKYRFPEIEALKNVHLNIFWAAYFSHHPQLIKFIINLLKKHEIKTIITPQTLETLKSLHEKGKINQKISKEHKEVMLLVLNEIEAFLQPADNSVSYLTKLSSVIPLLIFVTILITCT